MFNMKIMAFIEPKLIKKFYSLITDKYDDNYEKFFKYFEKTKKTWEIYSNFQLL